MMHSPVPVDAQQVWDDFRSSTLPLLRDLPAPALDAMSARYAVIVEPRPGPKVMADLEYAIRNVMHFLGSGWGLQVFGSAANTAELHELLQRIGFPGPTTTDAAAAATAVDAAAAATVAADVAGLATGSSRHSYVMDSVEAVDYWGPHWNFTKNSAWYQYMFVSVDFWDRVRGDKVLIFQPDTVLLHSAIKPFLKYAYVGAPWSRGRMATADNGRGGIVGNGGLSLRSTAIMRECVREPFLEQRQRDMNRDHKYLSNEDLLFGMCLLSHPTALLPSRSLALRFSVETVLYERPLGIHAPWRHLPAAQVRALLETVEYLPERKREGKRRRRDGGKRQATTDESKLRDEL